MLENVSKALKGALLTCVAVGVAGSGFAQSLEEVKTQRGLTDKDILAAAKTYTPSGMKDEYYVFSSGGQAGQVIVYGVPSMRILKYIGVFTPEPWQGWGFDKHSKDILAQGKIRGKEITWGDTHHPGLSETKGDYDGQYLFINDKANPRVAVIDLKTFETTQIVVNPIFKSEHGSTIVTPNTEYVIEVAQYAAPFEDKYVPLEDYNDKYRGGVTYWKFDRKKGKIDIKRSFTVELPPYMQDVTDAGKGPSYGWSFTNTVNSERYQGGFGNGNVPEFSKRLPNEAGMSAKDTDYMTIVNWKAAEKLFQQGKYKKINDHAVISMDDMVKANALFLVPEPKSPHGNDVSPDGTHIIVAGKLDTHASVYSWTKMKNMIDSKDFASTDPYGLPILDLKRSLARQVNLGLGPLHTQYGKGDSVYTSLYVESSIVHWNYKTGKVLEKMPINYNVGHLVTAEGDTVDPDGKYLISLNKLAIDRFLGVGPLHPQNHQLIDIKKGQPMQLLYDMPLPLGEPHYAQMIKADKLKPIVRYKKKSFKHRVRPGREKVVRNGNNVTIYSTAIRSHYSPEVIKVKVGDKITWHMSNVERAQDQTHGFTVDGLNIHGSLEPGETSTFEFVVDKEGVYPFYCTEFCSALHLEMTGYLLVEP
ncbi:MAG: cytochrome C [SAR324 cluster bacterium]|uniref:Cytochrome C n=1 Tax=SAR324 cluster bacterium TaxID=2024889 RepID=A0A2A4SVC5_9DELT|nr:MAG: cytochrome C [SAR324 cluster bacterium]